MLTAQQTRLAMSVGIIKSEVEHIDVALLEAMVKAPRPQGSTVHEFAKLLLFFCQQWTEVKAAQKPGGNS